MGVLSRLFERNRGVGHELPRRHCLPRSAGPGDPAGRLPAARPAGPHRRLGRRDRRGPRRAQLLALLPPPAADPRRAHPPGAAEPADALPRQLRPHERPGGVPHRELLRAGRGLRSMRAGAFREERRVMSATTTPTDPAAVHLRTLDRLLPVWILLAMALGLLVGRLTPGVAPALGAAQVSGVSLPI